MLKNIFEPERDKLTGEWRRLHKEELCDLYCSPNIIWVIKLRRMRWAGHVARLRERRGVYRVLVGVLRERDNLEDLSVEGRVILKWVFKRWDGEIWSELLWLRIGTGCGRF